MPEDDRTKRSAAESEALFWEEGRVNAEMLTRLAEEATATAVSSIQLPESVTPEVTDEIHHAIADSLDAGFGKMAEKVGRSARGDENISASARKCGHQ